MSTFAIGDIHGCLEALKLLCDRKHLSPDTCIVFLGDYVDRGPDVAGTIDFLIGMQSSYKCVFLKGNHEIMMKNAALHDGSFDFWYRNGGKQTLLSYGLDGGDPDWAEKLPEQHWAFLNATLPYYALRNQKFVHASLAPGVALAEQSSEFLYWKKIDEHTPPYSVRDIVYCGHTAQIDGEILNLGHTICIDTCAYGDQWLTMLDCDEGHYWQASQSGLLRKGKITCSFRN